MNCPICGDKAVYDGSQRLYCCGNPDCPNQAYFGSPGDVGVNRDWLDCPESDRSGEEAAAAIN